MPPTPTKDRTSVDELEEKYNAPTIEDSERNTIPRPQQPITPPEEANPGYQQTGEPHRGPNEGDSTYGDSTPKPKESGRGEYRQPLTDKTMNEDKAANKQAGSKSTGKQKWRDRAKDWNNKRKAAGGVKNMAKDYAKDKAKQAAKAVAKKIAKQAIKRGADAVAPGSGELAGEVAERLGKAALAAAKIARGKFSEGLKDLKDQLNALKAIEAAWKFIRKLLLIAVIAGTTLIILLFILLVSILAGIFGSDDEQIMSRIRNMNNTINLVTITKTGPPSGAVNNDAPITYTIGITAVEGAGIVTVEDPLPANTTYVSSTGTVTCESDGPCTPSSRTVKWTSTNNSMTAPFTTSFTITVRPTVRDAYIINKAKATSARDVSCEGDAGYVCAYKNLVAYTSIGDGWGAGRNHMGVDLIAPQDVPQYAIEDGVVVSVDFEGCNRPSVGAAGPGSRVCTEADGTRGGQSWQSGQSTGWHVKLHDKNNRYHFYMHQVRKSTLQEGQTIHAGEIVGYTGTTGNSGTPHLHYQISYPCNDEFNCWSDPASILANWPNY